MLDKTQWYDAVQVFLNDNLQDYYNNFYNSNLIPVGTNYRLNPCPVCGHMNCCTISGNTVHCFSGSCDWRGTHINAWYAYATEKLGINIGEAVKRLADYVGIPFPAGSKEDMEAYEKVQKQQAILRVAEEYYHKQLLECEKSFDYDGKKYLPLDYMLTVRKRKMETLKTFKVGFSHNYFGLQNNLLELGYTKEEIKEAKVWVPEGLLIFFYKHPTTKDIVRLNTKNPFKVCFQKKDEMGNRINGDVIAGFSTGNKFLYFPPDFSFKKDVIIVEGENDLYASLEQGLKNVVAGGGQFEQEFQLSILDNKLDKSCTIYTFFDNDEAGEKYVKIINDFFADRPVKRIEYDTSYKDPDEFIIKNPDVDMKEFVNNAVVLETDKHKIRKKGNEWTIATRDKRLDFIVKVKPDSNTFKGTAVYYLGGNMVDRDEDIPLVKCKAKIKPLNFFLLDEMEKYFNEDLDKKSSDELISIYNISTQKERIIKLLARNIYDSNNDEDLINGIKVKFKEYNADFNNIVDEILKEVNDIQNRCSTISLSNIPKIRIGQYFNVRNNDAYMYFTYVKIDGDIKRKLPFLLRNDKSLIRLDLLKRKDNQCLLLVDNKYELPFEVPDAILELNQCSLTQEWVEKYVDGKIPDNELEPVYIIKEIERYIRKFYFADNSVIYKIIALYIYTTYFYELFAQVPYLFLNGSKGSGKSILDEIIKLLAFNSRMAVHITEAAMFRMLSFEGGTLILDEQEGLTSKGRTTDSAMAAILKGGYARSGCVYRTNTDRNTNGNKIDSFSIYGPKIISNIMGIDDVIEDRCIVINTYALHLTKDTKMEDPKHYGEEKLDEIRELTSKCSISALRNFKLLYEIYNKSLFETGSARLSQILTPLQAIATLVDLKECELVKATNPDVVNYDGEYSKALRSYWDDTLQPMKENVEKNTPEGIIKRSVACIANEILGNVPEHDIEFIYANNHKYNDPIKFNIEEGWFEINVIHFKCFIEESRAGETAYARYIPRWIRTVFKFENSDIKRKIVNIENEDLIKEFKGNMKPKVNIYRFYFRDFVNDDTFLEEKVDTKTKKNKPLF